MSVSLSVNCVVQSFSCDQLFPTLQIVACQAPLSMGFPRQEYWSELPCLPPGIELPPLLSPALADGFFTTEPPGKPKTKISLAKFSALFFFSFIIEILLVVLRISTQTFQFVRNSSHTYQKSKKSCSCIS